MTVRFIINAVGDRYYYNDNYTSQEQARVEARNLLNETQGRGEIVDGARETAETVEQSQRARQAEAVEQVRRERQIHNNIRPGVRVAGAGGATLRGYPTGVPAPTFEYADFPPTPRTARIRPAAPRPTAEPTEERDNVGGPQYNCLRFTRTLED